MSLQELIELKEDMDRQLNKILKDAGIGSKAAVDLLNAREEVMNSITYRAKIMIELASKKVA